jgi:hypothetical protein
MPRRSPSTPIPPSKGARLQTATISVATSTYTMHIGDHARVEQSMYVLWVGLYFYFLRSVEDRRELSIRHLARPSYD